ncbi:MAG: hypothetical protein A2511_10950 [Deltaproteobacteria bacterium RIFOXYD12_FULL_50_9]|nr:MAG: hypothetical protein A2511_10950 [Deltaproteobacteria bacterium RIFOXYD12_FULL_50_9]
MATPDFLVSIIDFFNNTEIPRQLKEVDAKGLFTNWYFLAPLIGLFCYMLWKQAWDSMILIVLGFGLWMFSGSQYMKNVFVDGQLQLDAIAPIIGVGIAAIAIIIYVLFIRSD